MSRCSRPQPCARPRRNRGLILLLLFCSSAALAHGFQQIGDKNDKNIPRYSNTKYNQIKKNRIPIAMSSISPMDHKVNNSTSSDQSDTDKNKYEYLKFTPLSINDGIDINDGNDESTYTSSSIDDGSISSITEGTTTPTDDGITTSIHVSLSTVSLGSSTAETDDGVTSSSSDASFSTTSLGSSTAETDDGVTTSASSDASFSTTSLGSSTAETDDGVTTSASSDASFSTTSLGSSTTEIDVGSSTDSTYTASVTSSGSSDSTASNSEWYTSSTAAGEDDTSVTPVLPEIPDEPPILNATVFPPDGDYPCIWAEMRVMLTVPYRKSNGEEATKNLPVPSHAVHGGSCEENNNQRLSYVWNWSVPGSRRRRDTSSENEVNFIWTNRDGSFTLSEMSMNISKNTYLDQWDKTDTDPVTVSKKGLSLFAAPAGMVHACAAASSVHMDGGAGITLSDVKLSAFSDNTHDFSAVPAVSCPTPRDVSNGIYIVVAAILGGFALAALVGYAVYHVRTRRGALAPAQFSIIEDEVA